MQVVASVVTVGSVSLSQSPPTVLKGESKTEQKTNGGDRYRIMAKHCKFWLPKKKRFCANTTLHDSLFCGNHTNRSNDRWIPCPIDPSHSVLEENLRGHLKKCPLLKQVQSLSLQPFYHKGINAATPLNQDQEEGPTKFVNASNITSEMKRNAVFAMTVPQFSKLITKISSIHASLCNDIPDSYKIPEACGIWINRQADRKLPFQEKHVLQQASILGNLEAFGVFNWDDNHGVPAVVEFGAGRGYLTQMLADCYRINKVFLVERKSYKLKADRSLRQKEGLKIERFRIDIEDLNLNAVESLQEVPSYLAIGKHLCGPATDMTLRCCLREQCNQGDAAQCKGSCYIRGLAIATCCHHLCQWEHYINKSYLSNLGITMDDFHAISWFTSWAVDADHGSDISGIDCRSQLQISEKEECACGAEEIMRNMRGVERAVLGFMCKDIIDVGRLVWMKEHGLESQLVKYVPSSISPENHLLIAMPGTTA